MDVFLLEKPFIGRCQTSALRKTPMNGPSNFIVDTNESYIILQVADISDIKTSFIPWFLFHGALLRLNLLDFFLFPGAEWTKWQVAGPKRASLGCYRHSSTQCKANLEPVLQLKNKGKGLLELDFEKYFTVKDRLIIAQWQEWAWCKCNIVEEPAYDLQGLCQCWICYVFIRF